MFQKPANTYQGMIGALALAESDFIDLSTFMKNKKYDNMDEEQKRLLIKNTLEEAIKTKRTKNRSSQQQNQRLVE
jgi:hypothetical protein